MKRILYLEVGPPSGKAGIGGSMRSLLNILQILDRKHYVSYIALYFPLDIIPQYEEYGGKVFVLSNNLFNKATLCNTVSKMQSQVKKFLKLLLTPSMHTLVEIYRKRYKIWKLCRIILAQNIDIVHCNGRIGSNIEGIVASIVTRRPFVVHQRRLDYNLSALSVALAKRARKLVAISQSTKANLLSNGFSNDHILLLHNWVNSLEIPPFVPLNDLGEELVIASIGSISRHKGQDLLISSAALLRAKGLNFRIHIYGSPTNREGEEYLEHLKSMVYALDLEGYVVFKGYLKNRDIYKNAISILAHTPPEPEPFGRVLIESMMHSIPVVASRDGGILDIVEDGKSGILFEPGNVTELAESLYGLAKDNGLRARLALQGYTRVTKLFTEEGKIALLHSLYS